MNFNKTRLFSLLVQSCDVIGEEEEKREGGEKLEHD